jgi:hypothetical protein
MGPVLKAATACGRIAPQFARDRRGRSFKLSSDRSNTFTSRARQRNLFALCEGKVAT